jgi:DNA polymerase III subunit delta'
MSQIIGHENIIKDFKRLASGGMLSHAYLFFGPKYIGKHLFAESLANFLENKKFEPAYGSVLTESLNINPASNGSIGIDQIRLLQNFLSQMPNRSSYRTVIVRDAESLTAEAQNALLKIAEEPLKSSLIILVTSDEESLSRTLSSRLQKIYFGLVPSNLVKDWLCNELGVSETKINALVALSSGRPGLAHRILNDKVFNNLIAQTKQFIRLNKSELNNFVKELAADEDFDLDSFLEALAITLVTSAKVDSRLWHELMKLRKNSSYFNLNKRLQLTSLGELI